MSCLSSVVPFVKFCPDGSAYMGLKTNNSPVSPLSYGTHEPNFDLNSGLREGGRRGALIFSVRVRALLL